MSRTYGWSTFFAWSLTLSGAALALGGVIGAFAPDHRAAAVSLCIFAAAVMMAAAIACSNVAAGAAIRALRHRKVIWAVLLPAVAIGAGLGFVAQMGIHLGWDVLKSAGEVAVLPESQLAVALWITAFAKPVMALLIEGLKSLDAEDEAVRRAANRVTFANDTSELDAARARREALDANPVDAGHPPLTQARVDAARSALLARGAAISQAAVARELSVSKDRVHRAINSGGIRLAA